MGDFYVIRLGRCLSYIAQHKPHLLSPYKYLLYVNDWAMDFDEVPSEEELEALQYTLDLFELLRPRRSSEERVYIL